MLQHRNLAQWHLVSISYQTDVLIKLVNLKLAHRMVVFTSGDPLTFSFALRKRHPVLCSFRLPKIHFVSICGIERENSGAFVERIFRWTHITKWKWKKNKSSSKLIQIRNITFYLKEIYVKKILHLLKSNTVLWTC